MHRLRYHSGWELVVVVLLLFHRRRRRYRGSTDSGSRWYRRAGRRVRPAVGMILQNCLQDKVPTGRWINRSRTHLDAVAFLILSAGVVIGRAQHRRWAALFQRNIVRKVGR